MRTLISLPGASFEKAFLGSVLSSAELVSNQKQEQHFCDVWQTSVLGETSFMNCA